MESTFLQSIFALPLFVAGVFTIIWALVHPGSIGIFRLSFFAFTMQFCMGPALSFLPFQPGIPAQANDVTLAFMGVYLFWFGALVVAALWRNRFEKVSIGRYERVDQAKGIFQQIAVASSNVSLKSIVVLYVLTMFIKVYVIIVHGIGLSGVNTIEAVFQVPYHVLVVYKIVYVFGAGFVFICAFRLMQRQPGRMLYVLIIATEFVHAFTQGRRKMFLLAFMVLFAWLIKYGRLRPKHAIIGTIALAFLWQLVFPFFVQMRKQWQSDRSVSIVHMVTGAWSIVKGVDLRSEREQESYARSVRSRFNAMSLNYLVANSLNSGRPQVGGELLKVACLQSIPRIFFPNKFMHVMELDGLLNERLGIPGRDQFSNLPAFALADFRLIGCVIYGILFGLVLRLSGALIRVLLPKSPLGAIFVFSVMATNVVLQMETHTTTLISTLRLAIIIFLVSLPLASLLKGGRQPLQYQAALETDPERLSTHATPSVVSLAGRKAANGARWRRWRRPRSRYGVTWTSRSAD
ncbi:MAG: hypothetical protein MI923_01800 [Phycisphaerales bacterium]|nr:hypothetical protein [Phycisphaerales bacterium]